MGTECAASTALLRAHINVVIKDALSVTSLSMSLGVPSVFGSLGHPTRLFNDALPMNAADDRTHKLSF